MTGALCFLSDGTITAVFYNVLGCCHDSSVTNWGELYIKLERVYSETGLKFVKDSVFASINVGYFIMSSQDDLTAYMQYETYKNQVTNIAVK